MKSQKLRDIDYNRVSHVPARTYVCYLNRSINPPTMQISRKLEVSTHHVILMMMIMRSSRRPPNLSHPLPALAFTEILRGYDYLGSVTHADRMTWQSCKSVARQPESRSVSSAPRLRVNKRCKSSRARCPRDFLEARIISDDGQQAVHPLHAPYWAQWMVGSGSLMCP